MTKTEAAEILANYTVVRARQRGVKVIDRTIVAECVSEAQHQAASGTKLNQAGTVNPSYQTIRSAGRRVARPA